MFFRFTTCTDDVLHFFLKKRLNCHEHKNEHNTIFMGGWLNWKIALIRFCVYVPLCRSRRTRVINATLIHWCIKWRQLNVVAYLSLNSLQNSTNYFQHIFNGLKCCVWGSLGCNSADAPGSSCITRYRGPWSFIHFYFNTSPFTSIKYFPCLVLFYSIPFLIIYKSHSISRFSSSTISEAKESAHCFFAIAVIKIGACLWGKSLCSWCRTENISTAIKLNWNSGEWNEVDGNGMDGWMEC